MPYVMFQSFFLFLRNEEVEKEIKGEVVIGTEREMAEEIGYNIVLLYFVHM